MARFRLALVLSGGQVGIDRAALDAAMAAGLSCGGWCPPGRASESGPIPATYPLRETPEDRSPAAPEVPRSLRTDWNVRDADAVLVLLDEVGKGWLKQNSHRVELHRLPAYSPELNPTEGGWKATRRMATHNRFYLTTEERDGALVRTFKAFQRRPGLIAAHVARFQWSSTQVKVFGRGCTPWITALP